MAEYQTPLDGAAAVLALLFRKRVIPYNEESLNAVAKLTGVPASSVNEAMAVIINDGYTAPTSSAAELAPRARSKPRKRRSDRKYPDPDQVKPGDVKRCACGEEHPLAEFSWIKKGRRADDSQLYAWDAWSNECRRRYSRDRYLSVAKEEALEGVGMRFQVEADDLTTVALVCVACGEPFVPGDEVEGHVQLWHGRCADLAREADAAAAHPEAELSSG